jgi:PAS domain S-box-containing protein
MIKRLRGIRGVFAIMAIVIAGSTIVTFWAGQRVIDTQSRAVFHRHAIAQSEEVLSTLKDAETGQRGFIITGDEKYLEPYNVALVRLPEEVADLKGMTKVAIPVEDLAKIKQLVQEKLSDLQTGIQLRRTSGFDAAAAMVKTGVGKETMDNLRVAIAQLQQQQETALRTETNAVETATRTRTLIFTLSGLISLLFIVWAYQRISSAIKGQEAALAETEAARSEIQRQKDLLSVTLSSIGDCVIVSDEQGRITFMNDVAEKLTGWSFAEARLQPTGHVFRIVNEHTREPVENPVEKVMTTGVIVGLANHTLLITKDGSEVPIDDSGAPIKEADGTIRGAVLVFRDFSEHKEAERALQEAKETAENANKAKDQFLAMLSHELRTPLTPVLATLNLWEASDDLPPSMQGDVQMLRRSVELEARIIDDLLDLTRIAKGMLSFSPEDTDVHEVLQFLVGICHSEFHQKRLLLLMQLHAPNHYVHTDAGRLQQVLWNIIKNAAKFTEAGGTITILTSNDALGNLSIAIRDTGIGMTTETIARLFRPFEQADQRLGRRYGGLGLGMAISRALVELLGGAITAESAGLGEGSLFTVTFPAMQEVHEHRDGREVRKAKRPEEGRMKILLVEDHGDTAQALVRLLTTRGYQVQTAGTVAAGIEAIQRGKFDLLVCDIGLPDGTGFQLLERVRGSCKTPALALSGFGMEEDVTKCKQAGFEAHLTKPVNFQKLEAAIWQLTSR